MATNYTRLPDALSAAEGTAFITIDGQNRPLFEIMKIEAKIEKKVMEKKLLGSKIVQHKVVGASISGSMTLMLMNGDMLKATTDYLKTGVFPNITLHIKNADSGSSVGAREVVLRNVIPTVDLLSMLDGESEEVVTYDTDFTADDMEILKDFNLPANHR